MGKFKDATKQIIIQTLVGAFQKDLWVDLKGLPLSKFEKTKQNFKVMLYLIMTCKLNKICELTVIPKKETKSQFIYNHEI